MTDVNFVNNIETFAENKHILSERLVALSQMQELYPNNTSIQETIDAINSVVVNLDTGVETTALLFENAVSSRSETKRNQRKALDIIRENNRKVVAEIKKIDEQYADKLKSIQMYTYYRQKYNARVVILKSVAVICFIVCILMYLKHIHLIPEFVYSVFLILTFSIGGYVVLGRIIDLYARNNMNFDEYDWKFTYPSDNKHSSDGASLDMGGVKGGNDALNAKSLACTAAKCCGEGTLYNKDTNQCALG